MHLNTSTIIPTKTFALSAVTDGGREQQGMSSRSMKPLRPRPSSGTWHADFKLWLDSLSVGSCGSLTHSAVLLGTSLLLAHCAFSLKVLVHISLPLSPWELVSSKWVLSFVAITVFSWSFNSADADIGGCLRSASSDDFLCLSRHTSHTRYYYTYPFHYIIIRAADFND